MKNKYRYCGASLGKKLLENVLRNFCFNQEDLSHDHMNLFQGCNYGPPLFALVRSISTAGVSVYCNLTYFKMQFYILIIDFLFVVFTSSSVYLYIVTHRLNFVILYRVFFYQLYILYFQRKQQHPDKH